MKNLIVFFFFLLPLFSLAQKTHTVAAKESLFSIGRLYDVHPRELATFNNIPFETGLNIGQVLKIPSKKTMAPVTDAPANAAAAKVEPTPVKPVKKEVTKGNFPVYHTVAKKEGLYGISKKYNVTIDELKKWNNLNSDGLVEGMNLIVGNNGSAPASVKDVPQMQEVKQTPMPESKPAPVVMVKETPKPAKPEVATKTGAVNFSGGVFKSFYNAQVSDKIITEDKGMAGIFKSTSGWEDGKYYCLHNAAPAGSYIKITNNATQKSVYAKVLDLIPDLSQNNGLVIRISNAAAAELGAGAVNFDCTLHF
ncbi:MAG: LysM peptidoglycan-binding domain-containing protein [Gloeobacteraceae cyanobacterium ES-bin-316]|nr:LysM peptidoglycan-binding domain-containing protein [Ferruginibacter sp.]